MVRVLSIVSTGCLLGAIGLTLIDAERYAAASVVLLLVSLPIGAFLGVRRGFRKAREIAGAAKSFVAGDVQHARIADIGEPRGFFAPSANMVLELEGEDGAIHRFDRDVPIPFPMALGHRLGRRLKLPFVGSSDLAGLMAFELRREGLDIDLDWRPPPDKEIVDGPVATT